MQTLAGFGVLVLIIGWGISLYIGSQIAAFVGVSTTLYWWGTGLLIFGSITSRLGDL